MSAATSPRSQAQAVPDRLWRWPVDLDQYDRRALLRGDELAVLAEVLRLYEQWPHSSTALRRAYRRLRPLLRPLHDVVAAMGFQQNEWSGALRAIIQEMHRSRVSFWGWTREEWWTAFATSSTYRGHGSARAVLMTFAYLVGGVNDLHLDPPPAREPVRIPSLARRIFGGDLVEAACRRVSDELRRWGYGDIAAVGRLRSAVAALLLVNRSPFLEDTTAAALTAVAASPTLARDARRALGLIADVLAHAGILGAAPPALKRRGGPPATDPMAGVPEGWRAWCQRWYDSSSLPEGTRRGHLYKLCMAGRWLARHRPELADPAAWDYAAAARYVAAVDRMRVGEWSHQAGKALQSPQVGQPLAARTKDKHLQAMRVFFGDCQERLGLARQFDPQRAFATPRSVRSQVGTSPRVIADDLWGKLLWAGLTLAEADLAPPGEALMARLIYPVKLVQALAIAWLFTALRNDELRRLPVGCIRWQREDVRIPGTAEILPKDAVCFLDVPTNKSSPPFTKPVDHVVGEALLEWERARPAQPALRDRKTRRPVHYLFAYRGKQIGEKYINRVLIPLLCRKANVPQSDARGPITSHRARSTIANALFNAPEPMTLPELKEWLGHKHLFTTQHYVEVSPLKQAKKLQDADYFGRALRMVDVLIDKEAVTGGGAAAGQPWTYYDLGHGYCTHPYFSQCPHRLVCAKCSFYRPKGEMAAIFEQAQGNLMRLREELSLTEEERAVVDEDLAGYAHLLAQLADVPAPDGQTPRQLQGRAERCDGGCAERGT